MTPLEIIGHIDIPPAVLAHRFVVEALGCATIMAKNAEEGDRQNKVVGTRNTKQVELYGWAPHVGDHVDNTGFVYLLALNDGKTTINVWNGDEPISVWLPAGAVARLDDYHVHWTEDDCPRVCAFIGSFGGPSDALALERLQSGVASLARGDYYGAPRVQPGFRALMPDECLVPNDGFDDCEPMLLKDARAQRRWYETCAHCRKPAVRLDKHWPYHTEMNRCAEHLKGE